MIQDINFRWSNWLTVISETYKSKKKQNNMKKVSTSREREIEGVCVGVGGVRKWRRWRRRRRRRRWRKSSYKSNIRHTLPINDVALDDIVGASSYSPESRRIFQDKKCKLYNNQGERCRYPMRHTRLQQLVRILICFSSNGFKSSQL